MKALLALVALSTAAGAAPALAQEKFSPLRGDYMGQSPQDHPQILLPGKIATGADEGSAFFLPDRRSFLWRTNRTGPFTLQLLEDREGRWQPPREVHFLPGDAPVSAFTLAPRGDFVYFTSGGNLWRVRLRGVDFSAAEPLAGEVNTRWLESHPAVTLDGRLYFSRRNPGNPGDCDIYLAKPEAAGGARFSSVSRLPPPLNSEWADYDPFIAPDGRYLIFASNRPGGHGAGDLYISFVRADGSWTDPLNLGPEINSPAEESRPSVTLDGRYFLFTSNRKTAVQLPPGFPPAQSMPGNGSTDLWWMKAGFLQKLK